MAGYVFRCGDCGDQFTETGISDDRDVIELDHDGMCRTYRYRLSVADGDALKKL